jgi:ribosome-associated protein
MKIDVSREVEIRTSRSGGKGGQNVNKVETQVEVRFAIASSQVLTEEQKAILTHKLAHRLSKEHMLIVKCNESRSQLDNKERALLRLHHILEQALQKRQARIATKIPKRAVHQRIESKKKRGEIKWMRRRPTQEG